MEIVSMDEVADEVLQDYYRDLMAPSFAPAELMTYDELRDGLHSTEARGLLGIEGGKPVAGLVVEEYLSGRVLLLAYVVVAAHLRGQGIGLELIKQAVADDPRLVLAEIEDPRFHPSDPQTGDPTSRARFYDRMGSRLLPIPFVQPSLRAGSPRVEDLLLIAIPSALPTPDELDGAVVAAFLDEYFGVCEGEHVVKHDEQYLALRRSALGEGSLPLVPLDKLHLARPARG